MDTIGEFSDTIELHRAAFRMGALVALTLQSLDDLAASLDELRAALDELDDSEKGEDDGT